MTVIHPVGTYSYRTARQWGQRGAYFQSAPSGLRARVPADVISLAPIPPAPVKDFRTLDFTKLICAQAAGKVAGISEVVWDCEVSPASLATDPDPGARLIDDPTISECGYQTTQLFGDMVEGVTYLLTVTAEITDGRVLVRRGSLPCVAPQLPELEEIDPCRVPFDFEKFAALFPELVFGAAAMCADGADGSACPTPQITPEQAEAWWRFAEEILRNDCTSPVTNLAEREDILLLLTAHIGALLGGPMGGGGFGSQITGTIGSKSVNGVSISSGGMFAGVSGSQGWYHLTRYGQLAWMKLRAYRLFHYVPGPQRDILSPFTSWPWKIGGAPGYMWMWGWRGTLPLRPRPPEPPDDRVLYVDRVSIVGDGLTPQTALAVRLVQGGTYGEGLGRMAPQALGFPLPQGRASGFTVWIDSVSLRGNGLTPSTALAVNTVAGEPGAEPVAFAPVAVSFPSWPPRFFTDGRSLVGDALTPETALSVRVVAG